MSPQTFTAAIFGFFVSFICYFRMLYWIDNVALLSEVFFYEYNTNSIVQNNFNPKVRSTDWTSSENNNGLHDSLSPTPTGLLHHIFHCYFFQRVAQKQAEMVYTCYSVFRTVELPPPPPSYFITALRWHCPLSYSPNNSQLSPGPSAASNGSLAQVHR